jgi:hypothetical protein
MLHTSPLAPARKPPIPPRAGGGSRRRPEQALQRSVVERLQWRARPNIWWTHIPLGGARSKIEAAIFKGLGVRRGAPDLLIVIDGRACFLELKAPGGRVTAAQHECHAALRAAGAEVVVATDIDAALAALERWDVLRPDERRTG